MNNKTLITVLIVLIALLIGIRGFWNNPITTGLVVALVVITLVQVIRMNRR